jgi:hypothetical protein
MFDDQLVQSRRANLATVEYTLAGLHTSMRQLEPIDQEPQRISLTESTVEVVREIDLIAELTRLVHHADESQSLERLTMVVGPSCQSRQRVESDDR